MPPKPNDKFDPHASVRRQLLPTPGVPKDIHDALTSSNLDDGQIKEVEICISKKDQEIKSLREENKRVIEMQDRNIKDKDRQSSHLLNLTMGISNDARRAQQEVTQVKLDAQNRLQHLKRILCEAYRNGETLDELMLKFPPSVFETEGEVGR
jgi:hypothetical protein